MLFANQRMRTPLTVGGEVAVFQVVAGEASVASGVVVFEDGEGKAGEAVHMHLIRGQRGAGADGIVVSKFHVRQVDVPVVLSFVDDHRQHLSHGVVDEKKKDELRTENQKRPAVDASVMCKAIWT